MADVELNEKPFITLFQSNAYARNPLIANGFDFGVGALCTDTIV